MTLLVNVVDVRWCRTQTTCGALEFQLHRMMFLQYLSNRQVRDAILYARSAFPSSWSLYAAQIQQLMVHLMYTSTNRVFITDEDWTDLQQNFVAGFCKALAMSRENPFTV